MQTKKTTPKVRADDPRRNQERLEAIVRDLEKIDERTKFRAVDFYQPYAKQQEFHDLGLLKRERLLMAGNRNGKTYCGAAELAYHLTGDYPDWWLGRRWDRPVKFWAASDTGLTTRDIMQKMLLGEPGVDSLKGTGMIPKAAVIWKDVTLARGISDLYDMVPIKHKSGGISILKFKSYEQGRTKWQGDSLDGIWFDEEPPMDIYAEGLARIGDRDGMVYVTFTPLKGVSEVVYRYTDEVSPDRGVVYMTIDDAMHLSDEQKRKMVEGYLPHEREARARGVPALGSGKVFHTLEEAITVTPFVIPPHWKLIWGTDFGIEHPFAAVLMAWDVDNNIYYVIKCIRMKDAIPLLHTAAMKPCLYGAGLKVPVAWPQDGHQRKEFEGGLKPLAQIYKKHGLKMMDHHAVFSDGSNSTEAGIIGMDEEMKSAHFKVFSTEKEWFEEYRNYHRKEGKLVKVRDDLMSATRVAWMARRYAQPVLWVPERSAGPAMAKDIDIDPWER